MNFSFIIPVYNRPEETKELLESLALQSDLDFEIVIIEDGSTITSEEIVKSFQSKLNISYLFKENTGPGDSRNYGMKRASGDYFIILDSDCILPTTYFENVKKGLNQDYVDCFGGPDKALDSFSDVQKAINYAMTSFFTTGGIRGGSEKLEKFQPRSFNMGLSKKAFEESKGFGNIHPGEDPDLSIRLWKKGYKTTLIKEAFVYHKRRIDWNKFFTQVNKFGKARPILDSWYPEYSKITFWFPSLFLFGILFAFIMTFFQFYLPLIILFVYFLMLLIDSTLKNKSLKVGVLSVLATFIQFYGYGKGFLISFIRIKLMKLEPKKAFPELFFK
ncbi:glycosyltransferase [uncultured Flavobacterium sp.]|uniref:glycosyltransferase n=1 Tax=uncultured Flavobacterium sp. TaxID=165435 RepID=UPI0030EE7BCA|tara:strand:- start:43834 stop:44826 length:993 start_codon:yes stop_codon:yes gene_type:complete